MTDLSPVTRTVLEAAYDVSDPDVSQYDVLVLANGIRALATYKSSSWDGKGPMCHWNPTPHVRQELLNIADELEDYYAS